MIQFQILSGQQAGQEVIVHCFPFLIGRGAESNLQLADPGVWDGHLGVEFQRGEGFAFAIRADALALINGERVESGILRHGDLIELGSVRLRFWLARSRQKTLRLREFVTWVALFALFLSQLGLIYWLLR